MRLLPSFPLAILLLAGACGSRAVPPAAPPVTPMVVIPSPPIHRFIRVCVVQDGELALVTGQVNTVTGDTSLAAGEGERGPARPDPYAATTGWYARNEPITHEGSTYVKFSTPRMIRIEELVKVGEYRGVPVFAQFGDETRPPEILMVPVRRGCEFQPYALQPMLHGVRG